MHLENEIHMRAQRLKYICYPENDDYKGSYTYDFSGRNQVNFTEIYKKFSVKPDPNKVLRYLTHLDAKLFILEVDDLLNVITAIEKLIVLREGEDTYDHCGGGCGDEDHENDQPATIKPEPAKPPQPIKKAGGA